MKYKLIAMDLDGTLLNNQKQITKATQLCLKNLKLQGYIIVAVTARNLGSIKNICDISMFNYLILNNGCYIYNVAKEEGKILGNISDEDIYKITKTMINYSEGIDYCSISKYYYLKHSSDNNTYIKSINSIKDIDDIVLRMNIFLKDRTKLEYYKNMINKMLENANCFIMQEADDVLKWLVINPKEVNKATSLKYLGEQLNIKLEDMIFFGDGLNDLEIIQQVGLGVAMGNAIEEVKYKAKIITKSNNEDGIAVCLNKLINKE